MASAAAAARSELHLSVEGREDCGERGTTLWSNSSQEKPRQNLTKTPLTWYIWLGFHTLNQLTLSRFFLPSSYGNKSDTCDSTSETPTSCSFFPPITIPDNYTIQVEARNADGAVESAVTHWRLHTIGACYWVPSLLFSQRHHLPLLLFILTCGIFYP